MPPVRVRTIGENAEQVKIMKWLYEIEWHDEVVKMKAIWQVTAETIAWERERAKVKIHTIHSKERAEIK